MKHATSSDKLLHQSALYEVWADMMRSARREQDLFIRYKLDNPCRIVDEFKDFDMFALWARLEMGYEIGRDDRKELARKDIHKPYGPDNCVFRERSEVVKELDFLKFEITRGASGVIYKDSHREFRWNGQSKTRLYNIWKTMCRACNDPSQKDYARLGGKGIRVQDEWRLNYLAFEDWAWEHGYTDELSLCRIDKEKDFTPNNCRWETEAERRLGRSVKHEKIRLSVKRMRDYLETIDDEAICTLIIAKSDALPLEGEQDDFHPTPVDERIDTVRT